MSDYQLLERYVTAAGERERIQVVAPVSGEAIGSVPACDVHDVEQAVASARAAQATWAATPLRERIKPFIRAHDMVLDARHAFADVIQRENGKARLQAIEEPLSVAIGLRYYAYNARRFISPQRRRGAIPPFTHTQEIHEPWGVVGIISPWNYPLLLAIGDAIPALIAGNAVVFKPSELTPFTLLSGVDLLYRAGVPAGLMQVVTGTGATGSALVDRADYVTFTGSTAVGRKIAERCAARLAPYSMELGGKNPVVVLDDADQEKASASVVEEIVSGSGQTCVSVERLYIQTGIYDTFVPLLTQKLEALKIDGSMTDLDTKMGSLTSAAQLEKVHAHVADAAEKGARILIGGHPLPDRGPYFYAPTLLENVTPQMNLYSSETFGPVVALYRFGTDDEAVAAANASDYGLHASIYGGNIARAQAIGGRIQAGTVAINDTHKIAWASVDGAQGGYKQSGAGRRHGREGILKYTQTKNLTTQRVISAAPGRLLSPVRWEQFFNTVLRIMRRIPGLR